MKSLAKGLAVMALLGTSKTAEALSTQDKVRGTYENRIRFFAAPEKIFETFAGTKVGAFQNRRTVGMPKVYGQCARRSGTVSGCCLLGRVCLVSSGPSSSLSRWWIVGTLMLSKILLFLREKDES